MASPKPPGSAARQPARAASGPSPLAARPRGPQSRPAPPAAGGPCRRLAAPPRRELETPGTAELLRSSLPASCPVPAGLPGHMRLGQRSPSGAALGPSHSHSLQLGSTPVPATARAGRRGSRPAQGERAGHRRWLAAAPGASRGWTRARAAASSPRRNGGRAGAQSPVRAQTAQVNGKKDGEERVPQRREGRGTGGGSPALGSGRKPPAISSSLPPGLRSPLPGGSHARRDSPWHGCWAQHGEEETTRLAFQDFTTVPQ